MRLILWDRVHEKFCTVSFLIFLSSNFPTQSVPDLIDYQSFNRGVLTLTFKTSDGSVLETRHEG